MVWLMVGSGRGVFLNRHAKFVEGAIVFYVFRSDALGDGLRAFELHAGVEEAALLAAVQRELAFGAGTVGVEAGGENRAAVGASAASDGANHSRSAGAELIGAARAARRRLAISENFIFFFVLFGVAITAVPVLWSHKTSVHRHGGLLLT